MQTVSTANDADPKKEKKEPQREGSVCVCYNGNSRCSVSLSKWQYPSVLAPVVDPITKERREDEAPLAAATTTTVQWRQQNGHLKMLFWRSAEASNDNWPASHGRL